MVMYSVLVFNFRLLSKHICSKLYDIVWETCTSIWIRGIGDIFFLTMIFSLHVLLFSSISSSSAKRATLPTFSCKDAREVKFYVNQKHSVSHAQTFQLTLMISFVFSWIIMVGVSQIFYSAPANLSNFYSPAKAKLTRSFICNRWYISR